MPTSRQSRSWSKRATLGLFGLLSMAGAANAQGISSLADTDSAAQFTSGDLSFAVSDCFSTVAGGCDGVEMIPVGSGSGVAIELLGNGGSEGSNILSVANASASPRIVFTLSVTGLGRAQIAGVSAAVAGSYVSGTDISSTVFENNASNCSTTGGYSPGAGSCGTYPTWAIGNSAATTAFTPLANLSISYELGVNGSPGETLTLSQAYATFSTVTEPASIGVVGTAVTVIGLVRGVRTRRGAKPDGAEACQATDICIPPPSAT